MIRVLVAEDSPTVRELLVSILGGDPEIRVVGQARTGLEAVQMAIQLRPDLITMDVHMPAMDGLEATKEIMVHAPTPILIVSSRASQQQIELSLSAVRAGALMVIPTPDSPQSEHFAERCTQFLAMVRAMARVKVVRRWAASPPPAPFTPRTDPVAPVNGARLVAVAASTGGPAALQRILADLPGDFPVPVLVVQHIADGFVPGLAHWLAGSCDLHVKVAVQRERLLARTVYLAPDGYHLGVQRDGRALLSKAPPLEGFRPSATHLFESVAEAYGTSVIAVILTGMGRDGVAGLQAVRAKGGWVIAQDEATSVVYGMPREAFLAGVVDAVLPVQEIGTRLIDLTSGVAHGVSDSGR